MNIDDLKKYSVIVGGGSGCLFQPMSEDYTYILTAKHLFFEDKEDDRGIEFKVEYPDGTPIEIKQFIQENEKWLEKLIPFKLAKGSNYFPHEDEDTDIAILKVEPKIEGFDKICINPNPDSNQSQYLCGSPDTLRQEDLGDRYTNYQILRIVSTNNNAVVAQTHAHFNQNNIDGMSGGGVLNLEEDYVLISGVQSKMANRSNFQAGQIAYVPIHRFNEIIDQHNQEKTLSKLYPPYLKKFDFLLDDCFTLEVDEIDESAIENTRKTLRNKAYEITQSDITPIGIKNLFNKRLLLNNNESCCLSYKKVWIAWLEFLVIINIVKDTLITKEQLSDIFNSYRLKYSNLDDWTKFFRTDLMNSDYLGLKENSTIIVNTKGTPKRSCNLYIPKDRMIRIVDVPDRRGFRTDKGIEPHTAFNFVHLDFFKTACIIEKLNDYNNLSEQEIISKLKNEYYELFK